MILVTCEPIQTALLLESVASPEAGAIVLFLGVTRQFTAGRQTDSLEYDAYPEMAEKELRKLEEEARKRWSIVGCAIVHRLGHLELGEASVAISVSAPHRRDAFEAGQWLIDTLKQRVPIWKQENWSDGTTEWVHPGVTRAAEKSAE